MQVGNRWRIHGRKRLVDADFSEALEYVAADFVIGRNARDTSLLAADWPLFAMLIGPFQVARIDLPLSGSTRSC
jgi:hypothetical protein